MNGQAVTSAATYTAAIATLRSPAGHNPATASTFANPPKWSAYSSALSANSGGPGGASVVSIVQTLWSNGMEPLVVQWVRRKPTHTHTPLLFPCAPPID